MSALPPVMVPAETVAQPQCVDFKDKPAEYVLVDDIVRLDDTPYRVRQIRRFPGYHARIRFTLHPTGGGRPRVAELLPRQWLPVARGF